VWIYARWAVSGNKIVGFAARGGLNLVKMIPAGMGNADAWGQTG
jgi:hypothetical protein